MHYDFFFTHRVVNKYIYHIIVSATGPFILFIRNSGLSPVVCQPSSCTFQAVPHLEEYSISVVVKDQLGEENESYCFSIRDRGQRSFIHQTTDVLRNMQLHNLEGWTIWYVPQIQVCLYPFSGPCCEVERGNSWSDYDKSVLDHPGGPPYADLPLPGQYSPSRQL